MSVLVVGAGLAGLVAADRLRRAGVAVTVLEARDRVGGRTHGIEVAPGAWADAGAAYLGDRHTELLALLAAHDLKTTATSTAGASVFELGDSRTVPSSPPSPAGRSRRSTPSSSASSSTTSPS